MPKTNRKAESIPIGKEYGYWSVLGVDKNRIDYLICQCECENVKSVNVYSLTSGKSKSCGCKSADIAYDTRQRRNNETA